MVTCKLIKDLLPCLIAVPTFTVPLSSTGNPICLTRNSDYASQAHVLNAYESDLPSQVFGFSLTPPVQAADGDLVQATLERTTDTSLYSPPSPDPCGLAYLTSSGTLMISDGEVNEMPIFAGVNLFEATLSGTLVYTASTTSFSDEPAGIAYNPLNGHLFISDDTGPRGVYELDPGVDGLYHTSDDVITHVSSSDFGCYDPEGVAFDNWRGHLLMVDGTNEEVYDLDPGENGIFDGVPPAGDDQVTQFDTTILGLSDPEGIE